MVARDGIGRLKLRELSACLWLVSKHAALCSLEACIALPGMCLTLLLAGEPIVVLLNLSLRNARLGNITDICDPSGTSLGAKAESTIKPRAAAPLLINCVGKSLAIAFWCTFLRYHVH